MLRVSMMKELSTSQYSSCSVMSECMCIERMIRCECYERHT